MPPAKPSPASSSLAASIVRLPLPSGRGDPARMAQERVVSHADAGVAERLHMLFAAHPDAAALTGALAEQSPYLAHILRLHPDWLADALAADPQVHGEARIARFRKEAPETQDDAAFMRLVRRFRNEMALVVALADCAGVWGVDRATAALTATADAAVMAACDRLLRREAEAGRLSLADALDPGPGSGLVVLALGKHGAGELNYSSDIDLVVFFDPEAPALAPQAEAQRIYVRIAQGLVKLLQERTPDGFAFRVDLRLRPDPGSTQAAVSLPAAFTYYETLGQNWERAAFIKARPVAGDLALGAAFLKDLAPFIWRKYFDFAAIADIHAMKRQIHAVRGHEKVAVAGHDIKLGRGGIREIEFFVQTQQLVFGGRRPMLRGPRTLDMLAALSDEGWITPDARDELRDAYCFLRTVEHRLQMVADEQTQRLPDDEKTLSAFARFCGYPTLAAFGKALTKVANVVEAHYALLFEEGPSLATNVGSLVFTGSEDDPDTLATLARMGFREPARVTETVRGWHFGRRPAVTGARAREALTELTPALLASLGKTPDPDAGLAALDGAFGHMPAATELLTLLVSHARLRDLFADILGSAPRLATIVAQSPHVLDAMIDPAFLDANPDEDGFERRIREMVAQPVPMEDFLDRMREVARHENFLTSARMLSGVLTPTRAGEAYSAIAQASVRLTFERVEATFAGEYGRVKGASATVMALGRLGSRETTANSDLDLVVIYDAPSDAGDSDGKRGLDPLTWHARFTQRLIGAITAPTRRGILYEVDMRLRPSGSKGPLATQFTSFVEYFRTEAETWELVALAKARPVAGDPALCERLTEACRAVLAHPRDGQRTLTEIRDMRALLAREKGDDDPWDLKHAAGALTDLDFAAAAIVLTRGAEHPELAAVKFADIWTSAAGLGLLPEPDAHALSESRRLIGAVLHWQRLLVDGHFDPATLSPSVLRRIAAAVGRPDPKVLRAELDETRATVRALTGAILSGKG